MNKRKTSSDSASPQISPDVMSPAIRPPLCGELSVDDVPSDSVSDLSDDVFLSDLDDEYYVEIQGSDYRIQGPKTKGLRFDSTEAVFAGAEWTNCRTHAGVDSCYLRPADGAGNHAPSRLQLCRKTHEKVHEDEDIYQPMTSRHLTGASRFITGSRAPYKARALGSVEVNPAEIARAKAELFACEEKFLTKSKPKLFQSMSLEEEEGCEKADLFAKYYSRLFPEAQTRRAMSDESASSKMEIEQVPVMKDLGSDGQHACSCSSVDALYTCNASPGNRNPQRPWLANNTRFDQSNCEQIKQQNNTSNLRGKCVNNRGFYCEQSEKNPTQINADVKLTAKAKVDDIICANNPKSHCCGLNEDISQHVTSQAITHDKDKSLTDLIDTSHLDASLNHLNDMQKMSRTTSCECGAEREQSPINNVSIQPPFQPQVQGENVVKLGNAAMHSASVQALEGNNHSQCHNSAGIHINEMSRHIIDTAISENSASQGDGLNTVITDSVCLTPDIQNTNIEVGKSLSKDKTLCVHESSNAVFVVKNEQTTSETVDCNPAICIYGRSEPEFRPGLLPFDFEVSRNGACSTSRGDGPSICDVINHSNVDDVTKTISHANDVNTRETERALQTPDDKDVTTLSRNQCTATNCMNTGNVTESGDVNSSITDSSDDIVTCALDHRGSDNTSENTTDSEPCSGTNIGTCNLGEGILTDRSTSHRNPNQSIGNKHNSLDELTHKNKHGFRELEGSAHQVSDAATVVVDTVNIPDFSVTAESEQSQGVTANDKSVAMGTTQDVMSEMTQDKSENANMQTIDSNRLAVYDALQRQNSSSSLSDVASVSSSFDANSSFDEIEYTQLENSDNVDSSGCESEADKGAKFGASDNRDITVVIPDKARINMDHSTSPNMTIDSHCSGCEEKVKRTENVVADKDTAIQCGRQNLQTTKADNDSIEKNDAVYSNEIVAMKKNDIINIQNTGVACSVYCDKNQNDSGLAPVSQAITQTRRQLENINQNISQNRVQCDNGGNLDCKSLFSLEKKSDNSSESSINLECSQNVSNVSEEQQCNGCIAVIGSSSDTEGYVTPPASDIVNQSPDTLNNFADIVADNSSTVNIKFESFVPELPTVHFVASVNSDVVDSEQKCRAAYALKDGETRDNNPSCDVFLEANFVVQIPDSTEVFLTPNVNPTAEVCLPGSDVISENSAESHRHVNSSVSDKSVTPVCDITVSKQCKVQHSSLSDVTDGYPQNKWDVANSSSNEQTFSESNNENNCVLRSERRTSENWAALHQSDATNRDCARSHSTPEQQTATYKCTTIHLNSALNQTSSAQSSLSNSLNETNRNESKELTLEYNQEQETFKALNCSHGNVTSSQSDHINDNVLSAIDSSDRCQFVDESDKLKMDKKSVLKTIVKSPVSQGAVPKSGFRSEIPGAKPPVKSASQKIQVIGAPKNTVIVVPQKAAAQKSNGIVVKTAAQMDTCNKPKQSGAKSATAEQDTAKSRNVVEKTPTKGVSANKDGKTATKLDTKNKTETQVNSKDKACFKVNTAAVPITTVTNPAGITAPTTPTSPTTVQSQTKKLRKKRSKVKRKNKKTSVFTQTYAMTQCPVKRVDFACQVFMPGEDKYKYEYWSSDEELDSINRT